MSEQPEVLENQTLDQKKIAFAQSEHVEAVIALLRGSTEQRQLVGSTEFETLVNAVTLDAQSTLVLNFINQIDSIKKGSIHSSKI